MTEDHQRSPPGRRVKETYFNVILPPAANLRQFPKTVYRPYKAQIVGWDGYALAIGDSEEGQRLSENPVPEELRDQVNKDMGALTLEQFLDKYKDHVVKAPDWLIEDMGGNRTRPADS
jgi:hypothetical protein